MSNALSQQKTLLVVKKCSEKSLIVNPSVDGNARNGHILDANPSCLHCNTPMISIRSTKEFCSEECRKAAWYRRRKLVELGIVEHPLCLHGSFQSYAAGYRNKIDVIITDPPYGREYLSLYKDLATFALTTLCPGGWLLCLTGWGFDWDIRKLFNEAGLEYITVCTYLVGGATLKGEKRTSTGLRSWQQQAKPLLWYQKRGDKLDRRRAGTSDLVRAREPLVIVGENQLDRQAFHWQQCVEGFKHIVWNFANPQDVLCDPCMGSGTTLVAAYLQKRRHVIGIEKDAATYDLACQRVAEVQHSSSIGEAHGP